jgi:hypothetical protein
MLSITSKRGLEVRSFGPKRASGRKKRAYERHQIRRFTLSAGATFHVLVPIQIIGMQKAQTQPIRNGRHNLRCRLPQSYNQSQGKSGGGHDDWADPRSVMELSQLPHPFACLTLPTGRQAPPTSKSVAAR